MLATYPLPAFKDNYIWCLPGTEDRVAVVDPGDALVVLAHLRVTKQFLSAILITHHHHDHSGGIAALRAAFPEVPVYGPSQEYVQGLTHRLSEGDTVTVPGLSTVFQVLAVPGHTLGHLAYLGDGALFCGDSLFACGCGRFFEGTPEQAQQSLQKYRALPPETLVYCAHEYTLDNIEFATWVEPDNLALQQRAVRERARRAAGQPTLPSTLELECLTNPFMRYQEPTVIKAAEAYIGYPLTTDSAVVKTVRAWKDREFD